MASLQFIPAGHCALDAAFGWRSHQTLYSSEVIRLLIVGKSVPFSMLFLVYDTMIQESDIGFVLTMLFSGSGLCTGLSHF